MRAPATWAVSATSAATSGSETRTDRTEPRRSRARAASRGRRSRGIRYRHGMAVATQGDPHGGEPRTPRGARRRGCAATSSTGRGSAPRLSTSCSSARSCSCSRCSSRSDRSPATPVLFFTGVVIVFVLTGATLVIPWNHIALRLGRRRAGDRHRRDHPDAARRTRLGPGAAVDLPDDVARGRVRPARPVRRHRLDRRHCQRADRSERAAGHLRDRAPSARAHRGARRASQRGAPLRRATHPPREAGAACCAACWSARAGRSRR